MLIERTPNSNPNENTYAQTYYFDAPREPKRRREPRLALESQTLPLLEPATSTLSEVADQAKETTEAAAAAAERT